MEDLKKPSLEKVLKKLEGLDIREWKREDYRTGHRFIARIGGLTVCVSPYDDNGNWIRTYHQIRIVNQNDNLDVSYLYPKKNSVEQKCISKFYDKLKEEYEECYKKEFEEALGQVFSD